MTSRVSVGVRVGYSSRGTRRPRTRTVGGAPAVRWRSDARRSRTSSSRPAKSKSMVANGHRHGRRIPFTASTPPGHRSNPRERCRSPGHMAVPCSQPLAVRVLLGAGAVLLAAFTLHTVAPLGANVFFDHGVYYAVLLLASALTLARGVAVRAERLPWLL